ncbi:MAG: serine/threonine protein kinase [Candidatus Obscuribacterales bacterium]|nr:serine/threonine protein kinase [Candidatus Obscuribacterales bacterium]
MAEFQLVVSYRPVETKAGLVLVVAGLPVWSLVAPFCLGAFVVFVLKSPESVIFWQAIAVSLFFLAVIVGGFLASAMAEDDKIHFSKEGLCFPPFLLPRLGFKRNWSWRELKSATLHLHGGRDYLALNLGGHTLTLGLHDMPREKMDEFLLALELWAPDCDRSLPLLEYHRNLQNAGKSGLAGRTQMWQDELGRRFTATTFVPLEPGRKLQGDRLEVVRQLAFGGLSAIYLVQKNKTELFVLKEAVVPPSAEADVREMAEKHLIREAEILFALSHPNIVKVLDHFVENDRHYLLMDYVNGTDLRQLVKQNGALGEKQVMAWASKIAHILAYLHNNQPPVIHRDLTPDNLVLKNDGSIVLIDFGASNQFIGTATGTMVGKQAYIAPEQLRGKAVPQSDFYALGGTLYFLLTARDPRPLSQSDIKAVLPDISDEMHDLIAYLTAYETEDRCPNAQALIDRLDHFKSSKAEDYIDV